MYWSQRCIPRLTTSINVSVLNCALPFVDKMKLKIFTYTDINPITRVYHLKRIIEIYANGKLVVIVFHY